MQLLYCYIENHRNIKNQGFNFSSQYRFSYDKKNDILTIEDNPNYIPNFFGEGISEVTAIIGENGSGKTTVLDCLIEMQGGKQNNNDFDNNAAWAIWLIDGKIYPEISENKIKNKTQTKIVSTHNEQIKIIHYSPILNLNNVLVPDKYDKYLNLIDVSTDYLIGADYRIEGEYADRQMQMHKYKNVMRQIDFVKSANLNTLKGVSIAIPEQVTVYLNEISDPFEKGK